jgi:hypothetical protein
LMAIGEVAAPRIAGGHRDGTGDDGPRCRQSPPTRHSVTLVSLPDGGHCARNRSWRQRH